jgi:hypothetical protein
MLPWQKSVAELYHSGSVIPHLVSSTPSLQRNFAFNESYSTLPQREIATSELLELNASELEELEEICEAGGASSPSLVQERVNASVWTMISMIFENVFMCYLLFEGPMYKFN